MPIPDPSSDPRLSPLSAALFEASPDAVVVVDSGGTVRAANPAVNALFGLDPDALVGQAVEVLIPEPLKGRHVGHRRAFMENPHSRPMGAGLQLEGRRSDGGSFPIDVSLTPVTIEGAPMVAAFVRDATERRRGEALLEYVNQIDERLLGGADITETLALTADRARQLLTAAAAWIVTPDGGRLTVAAAAGPGTEEFPGAELSLESSLSAQTMHDGAPRLVEDMAADPDVLPAARELGLGCGMYVPLAADGVAIGVLAIGRARGQPAFTPSDCSLATVFAASAGLALSLGQARDEVEELRLSAEHDRIARDLHDTVIQRLFASGMALQGALRHASGPVAERINQVVDALDEVIREIRETIFDLQHGSGSESIRRQVRRIASDAESHLGYRPELTFRGPVDSSVADAVTPHLVAVLREALSNVARHAQASSVYVMVELSEDDLVLRVTDNGVGPPRGPSSGNGLANMAARAKELGGDIAIGEGPIGGTVVEWRVPARLTA